MRYVIVFILCFSMCGCVAALPYWVRRSVVHDDWVLVKEEGTLYRRYIPRGIRLIGNQKLIERVGNIESNNNKIIVFSSYQDAQESGEVFVVDCDSKKHLPKERSDDVH